MIGRFRTDEIDWLERLLEALPEYKVFEIIAEGYTKDYVENILVALADAVMEF